MLGDARKRVREIADEMTLDAHGRAQIEEGLDMLFISLEEELPNLKPGALDVILTRLNRRLGLLQQLDADRRRYPEIGDVEIERPIFIMGLPRSGTTVFHSIMAQDPDSRSPLTWEIAYPSPPSMAATFETDPRIDLWNKENLKPGAQHADPEFQKKHLSGALLPEECGKILAASQRWSDFNAPARVKSYMKWWMGADHSWDYKIHRQWLQHMQWRNPRKRWVLKMPRHILFLPELLNVYPDVCIVQTHRDPAPAMSSAASLLHTIGKRTCEVIDPKELGREMLELYGEAVRRSIDFRDRNPAIKVVDIGHKQVVTDPLAAVRAIYETFDLPLTAAAEGAMRKFVADNPKEAFGAHKYSLEEYGVSRDEVYERMGDYVGRFSEYF